MFIFCIFVQNKTYIATDDIGFLGIPVQMSLFCREACYETVVPQQVNIFVIKYMFGRHAEVGCTRNARTRVSNEGKHCPRKARMALKGYILW